MTDKKKPADYEVGYGRPPKQTRFVKGQSGNPKGRKKKPSSLEELFALEMERTIEVREGDKIIRITKREALVKSALNDAIKGKGSHRRDLLRQLSALQTTEPFEPTDDDDAIIRRYESQLSEGSDGDDNEE